MYFLDTRVLPAGAAPTYTPPARPTPLVGIPGLLFAAYVCGDRRNSILKIGRCRLQIESSVVGYTAAEYDVLICAEMNFQTPHAIAATLH